MNAYSGGTGTLGRTLDRAVKLSFALTAIVVAVVLIVAPAGYLFFVGVAVALCLFGAALALLVLRVVVQRTNLPADDPASRSELDAQRESLLTIINGMPQAIFTVNSSGKIRVYNASMLGLLDTNRSLSGSMIDDVLVLHDRSGEPFSLYEAMKAKTHFDRDDLSLRVGDGDERQLHLSVNRIKNAFSRDRPADDAGYVCVVRDITTQKSLDQERDEFISVVSHELRTPVTVAEGTISNLQYFLEHGTDPAKLLPSLRDAHEQVLLLATLINDLGTLSRAQRGVDTHTEPVDVRDLCEAIYADMQPVAAKKGLTFDLDIEPRIGSVLTSQLYAHEMLQNFVTNAIKYSQKGGVTLSAHRVATRVVFAVHDTGIGISKADQKRVFEKFYRSEDYRTRASSGTGLGLYVVAKLARILGTHIELKSRLNHGSTFSFELPRATTAKSD